MVIFIDFIESFREIISYTLSVISRQIRLLTKQVNVT